MCTTDDHEHYFVGCPNRLSQKLQREILRPKRRMIISGLSYRDYNDKTSNANTMKSDVYGLYFLSNPPFLMSLWRGRQRESRTALWEINRIA